MLPATLQVPAAVLLLGGGLLACFVGHRLFRIVLGIYGFVTGALADVHDHGASRLRDGALAMLVGGLAGALLLILAYFVGVALVGAALGRHHRPPRSGPSSGESRIRWWSLPGRLRARCAAMALQRYVIILGTAFGGAWTALVGALAIARTAQRRPPTPGRCILCAHLQATTGSGSGGWRWGERARRSSLPCGPEPRNAMSAIMRQASGRDQASGTRPQ